MMSEEKEPFSLWDHGLERRLTAAEAEDALVRLMLDPGLVKKKWKLLDGIDLLFTAVVANPSLQFELWHALTDEQKFWLTVHLLERPAAANEMVKGVVHHTVRERYEDIA